MTKAENPQSYPVDHLALRGAADAPALLTGERVTSYADLDAGVGRLAAWLLDQGEKGNYESSRAKVICSEAQWRVVDRSVQMLGGQGVTGDTPVMRIFTDMRAFRIYDGPSEVHRWSMARKLVHMAERAATAKEVA